MKNYSTEQLSRLLLTNATSEHNNTELTKRLAEELKKRTKGESGQKKDDISTPSKGKNESKDKKSDKSNSK